jgi:hypothetical protein
MSDLMLYGVLRMPYEMAMGNELSRRQFYGRVQEVVNRMEAAEAKLEELSRATPPSPSTASEPPAREAKQSIDSPEFRELLQELWMCMGSTKMNKVAAKIIAYIDGRTAGAAPEGYVLVPEVPTDDMIVAFAEQWYSKVRCIDDCEMEDCYAAMIAAAPSPTNTGTEEDK